MARAIKWCFADRNKAESTEPTKLMIIGIPRESLPGETRVAATPQTVGQIIKLGYTVVVESGAGVAASFADHAYVEAGAEIGSFDKTWASDVVLSSTRRTTQKSPRCATARPL